MKCCCRLLSFKPICCFSGGDATWLGLRHDGSLHWADGTVVDFLNWASGDPDYPGRNQDVFGIHIGGEMKDRAAYEVYPSLCQMGTGEINLTNDSPHQCSNPFVPLGDRCIFMNSTPMNWIDAVAECRIMCENCTLGSVHSQDELNVVYSLAWLL